MTRIETYPEAIRRAMRSKRMNIRQLEQAVRHVDPRTDGYSYEHIRKIVGGAPLMSEQFNELICKVLSLNADYMWGLAQQLKAKSGVRTPAKIAAPDNRLRDLWNELLPADHERVLKIVEGMVEERRAQRVAENTEDPEQIKLMITKLMERLVAAGHNPGVSAVPSRARR